MSCFPPMLECLIEVKLALEQGEFLKNALVKYCKNNTNNWSKILKTFLIWFEQGRELKWMLEKIENTYHRFFIELLYHGLRGQSIYKHLIAFEEELVFSVNNQIDRHISRLPIMALIPLLFLQLPAFLILFLGPFLIEIIKDLQ